jgi:hypothetical protein
MVRPRAGANGEKGAKTSLNAGRIVLSFALNAETAFQQKTRPSHHQAAHQAPGLVR